MNKQIVTLFIILLSSFVFAKSQGFRITTGFINDNYGTSFYYDVDELYNDGLHLIDDNGDGIYEYYYFSLSGHMLKDAVAPEGYKLNECGKFIVNVMVYSVDFIKVANSNVAIF